MSSRLVGRVRCGRILALALFLAAAAAVDSRPQVSGVFDTVHVRVFNFEVVVTDARDEPVRGLAREDFELLIDAEPTPIDYFSAVEGGETVAEARAEEADSAFREILSELREQYVLGCYPTLNLDDGRWREVKVRVRRRGFRARTRGGNVD